MNGMFKKVESLGDQYFTEHLQHLDLDILENNWWEGLKFFLERAFMRGRSDILSNEYLHFAMYVLNDFFNIDELGLEDAYARLTQSTRLYEKEWIVNFKNKKKLGKKNSIKHESFRDEVAGNNHLIDLLITPKTVPVIWDEGTYQKELYLGNDEDIMMVLDVLKWVSFNDKNIYFGFKTMINNKGPCRAFIELCKLRAISDKIARLIIRDMGLLNDGLIIEDDFDMVFPIDTWVEQKAKKLGCESSDYDDIRKFMLGKCEEYQVDTLKVAAGLWMWGSQKIDIDAVVLE